ncbi:sensor histidine kinase [Chitinimonas koreensis]|uniref:sensor histidine kinase n=1 Tax=Chitinimonas koreensis TaxID=356302 RepID=UPI0004080A3A|nr:HAMP domain-containing sensor histidine kinase [Chitinimonas koreensis]QNM97427.1 HAMP domain-containing histidine kinase [Chitinimonas koreensis]
MLRLPSFRQLLLLAFLLLAGLLGAVALRGLITLEKLVEQSRVGADLAVRASADAQLLAERSLAMERAARQFLVLDDAALRERFDEARRDARAAHQRLAADLPGSTAVTQWQEQLAAIEARLDEPGQPTKQRGVALAEDFRTLDTLNQAIAGQVRQRIEARNDALLAGLDEGRAALGRQLLGAFALALLLALGFGLWLVRPLRKLEAAIVRLGENRLDRPIAIPGPADLRALGRRLDWLRLRLVELDADKARFLRHISHELKTPLAALREGVSLLDEGVAGPLNDSQHEIARILGQNTLALQNQIEDLLRFNAAAFEARRLTRRPTELAAFIRGTIDGQRLQWQAKRLEVTLDGGPLTAEIDPDKLGAALGNLLSNAIRFSPDGGAIRFSLARESGRARIEIADQGPGVAPNDRERVFEPFYQGERQPPGARRGSGIGLSIVREYIVAHGGDITLLPGEPGARFRIELPHVDD